MESTSKVAAGSSPAAAREAAQQAVLDAAPDAGNREHHPQRHHEITIGAGLTRPQGRALRLREWTPQAIAAALDGVRGDAAWWSPHLFEGRYRLEANWQGCALLALDLDFHDGDGKHAAMPDDARGKLHGADLPGTLYHDTPRGARLVAVLAEPVTDADAYTRALEGYAAQAADVLAALGVQAVDGRNGLKVDTACTDLARLLYAPRATVDGKQRSARVVVMRDKLFTLADFPAVEMTTPAEPAPAATPALPCVPWDAFPGSIGGYGRAVAAQMEAPEPLIFCAMMAAISAVVPTTARIKGRDGHFEIAPMWFAPVAEPGSKKTPALNRILAPLEAHDARLQAAFAESQENHKAECAALMAQRKGKLAKAEQPPSPERAQLLADDFTFEALAAVLAANHGHGMGLLIAPDELMALFGSFDQYKRAGSDRQRMLKLWSAQPIRVNRSGRFIYVPSPRVAMIAGIQPSIALKLQALDGNDGLLERLHWSDCRHDSKPVFDVPSPTPAQESEWNSRVSALLPILTAADLRAQADALTDADVDARTYTLSDDARAVYRGFYESCDRRGLRGWQAGYMGKLAGQGLRAALGLHHFMHGLDVFQRPQVCGEVMHGAVTITKFLAAHTARIRSELSHDRKHSPAVESAVRWIRKQGGRAFLRDLQRANVAGVKSAEAAEALGAALVSAGVGLWGTTDTTAGHGRREVVLTEGRA